MSTCRVLSFRASRPTRPVQAPVPGQRLERELRAITRALEASGIPATAVNVIGRALHLRLPARVVDALAQRLGLKAA